MTIKKLQIQEMLYHLIISHKEKCVDKRRQQETLYVKQLIPLQSHKCASSRRLQDDA